MVLPPREQDHRGRHDPGFLETPLGWARANILYDKAKKPPQAGSLMEIVFILLWRMRQEIEFQRTRSIVQAVILAGAENSEDISKAFQVFTDASFPYQPAKEKEEKLSMKQVLDKEVSKGPLSLTIMEQPTKSDRAKLKRGLAALEERVALQKSGRSRSLDG